MYCFDKVLMVLTWCLSSLVRFHRKVVFDDRGSFHIIFEVLAHKDPND